ncbi:MAG: NINE protein [Muribaculaceae bacterium]|nr:NINE protein [Muribaculaceae bacterium]
MKSKTTMLLLWLFTGLIGGHRFYVEKTASGILYLFTFGLFFIGWALDFFRLGSMVDDYNIRYRMLGGAGSVNNNTNQNNNQNNIVINMTAPVAAAPAAPQAGATPQAAPAAAE